MPESQSSSSQPLIPEKLVAILKSDIDSRRIEDGMHRLASCGKIFESFDPSAENAAAFLGTLAQWCDIGYGEPELVKRLIATYGRKSRLKLTVSDYIHVHLAEGMVAMAEEMLDTAIDHFDIVQKLANDISAWDVTAVVCHWMARCQRKKGQYESALKYITRAREVQQAHGHVQNEGPARVLECLIFFERGDRKHAVNKLREAETILSGTDDHITLGNIQTTYGRILQRELRYGQAIKHYEKAIQHFQKCEWKFGNIGRALVDMSFTRLLMARHLRQTIEAFPERTQKSGRKGPTRAALVKELSNLHQIIFTDLDRAGEIYKEHLSVRGIGRVHLIRGHLYLERGELNLAAEEGTNAYHSAESRQDRILMGSARNLQCMVENASVEEEVEGWASHAVASQDYARDAVELASDTQDRRLLASAYTWYGLTLSNAFFNQRDRAREAMDRAAEYLESSVRDHLWEDFQRLRKRLMEDSALEPKLLQWASGEIGGKSFRQLGEDFADLVIPRIWIQEKKKVSRVAARLTISSRKVRRVLVRLGLLEAEPHLADEPSKSVENKGLPRSRGRVRTIIKLRAPHR